MLLLLNLLLGHIDCNGKFLIAKLTRNVEASIAGHFIYLSCQIRWDSINEVIATDVSYTVCKLKSLTTEQAVNCLKIFELELGK